MFLDNYTVYFHLNSVLMQNWIIWNKIKPAHWFSGRVFAIDPGDQGSISGWVKPKTQRVVLDTSLLNTQHYKIRFKGKVKQSREGSSSLPYISV